MAKWMVKLPDKPTAQYVKTWSDGERDYVRVKWGNRMIPGGRIVYQDYPAKDVKIFRHTKFKKWLKNLLIRWSK